VALGDSYTIGTGVAAADRWPGQLAARLAGRATAGPLLTLVGNLGVNGWTSGDVLRAQLPRLWPLQPEFVTLLVGVNDVVQGIPLEGYRSNVATILDALLEHLPAGRLLTVSTPDYTVTPAGAHYGDPTLQAAGIRAVNGAMARASTARGIAHVDVHDISLEAATDPRLIAADGLHPSAAQYARWVDRIAPIVERSLLG
jgi:lysophospholipase L1-like esterase